MKPVPKLKTTRIGLSSYKQQISPEKSCQGSLTIPSMSRFMKTGQSKAFIEVKEQKSVCMNKNKIVTKDMIGLNELKDAETTFSFLY